MANSVSEEFLDLRMIDLVQCSNELDSVQIGHSWQQLLHLLARMFNHGLELVHRGDHNEVGHGLAIEVRGEGHVV